MAKAKAKATKKVRAATKKKTTTKAATPKRKGATVGANHMNLTIRGALRAKLFEKAGGARAAKNFAMNAIETALGGT